MKTRAKIIGFVVCDECDDWSLPLTARSVMDGVLVLDWPEAADAFTVFANRKAARLAIQKTGAWRVLRAEPSQWPDPKGCVVRPLRSAV